MFSKFLGQNAYFCVGCRLLCEQFKVPAPNLLFEKKNDTSVTMCDLLQSHFDNCYHDRAAKYAMCGICGTGFSNYLHNPRTPAKVFIDPETKKPDPSLAEWEMVRHVVECKSQEFNNRQCQACRKTIAVNKSLRGMVSKTESEQTEYFNLAFLKPKKHMPFFMFCHGKTQ